AQTDSAKVVLVGSDCCGCDCPGRPDGLSQADHLHLLGMTVASPASSVAPNRLINLRLTADGLKQSVFCIERVAFARCAQSLLSYRTLSSNLAVRYPLLVRSL
ncbi:hypothetical protein, partial [Bradyrhizobium elkanii]|uniref:hypothetical protein n=1 Tax=Bradyrhizobium elkanii TaxID=29448 RepID=UPI001AEC51BB